MAHAFPVASEKGGGLKIPTSRLVEVCRCVWEQQLEIVQSGRKSEGVQGMLPEESEHVAGRGICHPSALAIASRPSSARSPAPATLHEELAGLGDGVFELCLLRVLSLAGSAQAELLRANSAGLVRGEWIGGYASSIARK